MTSSPFNATRVVTRIGHSEILMETGRLANQAHGAVWVQAGGTVVLVTVVSQPTDRDRFDFFPLTVDYQEKMYAAGRIPGSFFRREIGRPSEHETLCSRLMDRPIRPLFPKGFFDEVQVLATVLSADQENLPDVLALTGASAALHISPIPFLGPIAGGRVGRINGEFVLNPLQSELENSSLNIVLAASREAVVMVEGSASFIPEELLADALDWGHKALQPLIEAQEELRAKAGKPKLEVTPPEQDADLARLVTDLAKPDMSRALTVADKMERRTAKADVREKVFEAMDADERYADNSAAFRQADTILEDLTKAIMRQRIKEQGLRIDGRDLTTVRPIAIELGLLPRTHGSALFARGETKVLTVTTLGSGNDEQRVDTLQGDSSKRFMLHYNFPPYCVGEVKMVRVSRREIGHGALAERAILPVLPAEEEFPFTMRIVSEVMESNGSSSMATVCGSSLALMDAGVPIKAAVAGIAMGLIKEDDECYVLTDILGDEDALGDMDFKVAGTAEGVTAVQMDIKIAGISPEVMRRALAQARAARLHILDTMAGVLDKPRAELSPYAPQLEVVQVNPDVLRIIIGPGGKNIKAITAATGADIDIEDSGKVSIFAPTLEALEKAKEMVLHYDQRPELHKNYEATVKKIMEIGAVVEILPGVEALVHISQLDTARTEKASDVVNQGDKITVKVIEIGPENRIRASRAAVILEERGEDWSHLAQPHRPRPPRRDGDRPGGDGRHRDRGPRRHD